MAKVEGMPLGALEEGMSGAAWDGFDEYLDHLDGSIAVNAGFLVGHCAIRRRVMGAAAVGSDPTPAQMEEMIDLLHRSIEAGGLGFSTTLARTHSDGDGQPVASRWSSREELLAFAAAVSEHEGTTLEYASDGCLDGFDDEDVDLMIAFSKAGNRPLNWNVLTIDSHEPERYRNQLDAMDRCAAEGARVVALTMPVLVGMNMSFLNYCALNMMPDWGTILGLPWSPARHACATPRCGGSCEERAASPRDRRVLPADRMGSLRHRRHLLRRQRGPQRPFGGRHRRRTGHRRLRHAPRHRVGGRSADRAVARDRPTTTTNRGDSAARPGSTRR